MEFIMLFDVVISWWRVLYNLSHYTFIIRIQKID